MNNFAVKVITVVVAAALVLAGAFWGYKNINQKKASSSGKNKEKVVLSQDLSYYECQIYIGENNIFTTPASDSSGHIYSEFDSYEILAYDPKTQKCYILARRMGYLGQGLVAVTHKGIGLKKTEKLEAEGRKIEVYTEYDENNNIILSALPVRADIAKTTLFTMVPARDDRWVVNTIGNTEAFLGPPYVFPPEELIDSELIRLPHKDVLSFSKTYHGNESIIDDVTGKLCTPNGSFSCEIKKIEEVAAGAKIMELGLEARERSKLSKDSLFNPEESGDSDGDENIEADVQKGVSIPASYPEDVVPIMKEAKVAISEAIPGEEKGKEEFNITLKTDLPREKVAAYYKKAMKDASGLATAAAGENIFIYGSKKEYDFSIGIMPNTLGGKEKTVVQINVIPAE